MLQTLADAEEALAAAEPAAAAAAQAAGAADVASGRSAGGALAAEVLRTPHPHLSCKELFVRNRQGLNVSGSLPGFSSGKACMQ